MILDDHETQDIYFEIGKDGFFKAARRKGIYLTLISLIWLTIAGLIINNYYESFLESGRSLEMLSFDNLGLELTGWLIYIIFWTPFLLSGIFFIIAGFRHSYVSLTIAHIFLTIAILFLGSYAVYGFIMPLLL